MGSSRAKVHKVSTLVQWIQENNGSIRRKVTYSTYCGKRASRRTNPGNLPSTCLPCIKAYFKRDPEDEKLPTRQVSLRRKNQRTQRRRH